RIPTQSFQVERVPSPQVTLILGRPYVDAELDCLVDGPADPRVVARVPEMKLFGIVGKFQNERVAPRYETIDYVLEPSMGLQFELQGGIHADALGGGRDQSPGSLRIGCKRASDGCPRQRRQTAPGGMAAQVP